MNNGGHTDFRAPGRTSEWIEMRAGQRYYIEGHHAQGSSLTHFTVGVQIEPNDASVVAGSAKMTP